MNQTIRKICFRGDFNSCLHYLKLVGVILSKSGVEKIFELLIVLTIFYFVKFTQVIKFWVTYITGKAVLRWKRVVNIYERFCNVLALVFLWIYKFRMFFKKMSNASRNWIQLSLFTFILIQKLRSIIFAFCPVLIIIL